MNSTSQAVREKNETASSRKKHFSSPFLLQRKNILHSEAKRETNQQKTNTDLFVCLILFAGGTEQL